LNTLNKKFTSRGIDQDEAFTIGRAATNHFQIPDIRLSGKHCIIMKKEQVDGSLIVIVEDTSTNGTFVNGEKVSNCGIIFLIRWVRESLRSSKTEMKSTS
jgi:pSer/pThr/pTyr-binding forkhead associated (FHA) protein